MKTPDSADTISPITVRLVTKLCVLTALFVSVWQITYIALRTVQPYQLDAFEEYELMKALSFSGLGDLYHDPANETLPTAYPPLHYVVLRIATSIFGQSFLTTRLVSLIGFGGILAAGVYALWDGPAFRVALLSFVTLVLGSHELVGKWFELCKSDSLLMALIVWSLVLTDKNKPLASSLMLVLACLTKQNALLFCPLVVLAFAHRHGKASAITSMLTLAATLSLSYGTLQALSKGWFFYWVVEWTAGHGVDWGEGINTFLGQVSVHGSWLLIVVLLSAVRERREPWTWFLFGSILFAVSGLAKRGGIENHIYPFAIIGALVAARMMAVMWERIGHLDWKGQARWRFSILVGCVVFVVPQLPRFSDFKWIQKRRAEVKDWRVAIEKLDGNTLIAHHYLLARNAGADCRFSDTIMKFPNVIVARQTRSLIERRSYKRIVLSQHLDTVVAPHWQDLIEKHYRIEGELQFHDRSGLLPRIIYSRIEEDD